MNKTRSATCAAMICLLGSQVQAAEWRVESATYDRYNSYFLAGTPGTTFTDGQYMTGSGPLVPSEVLLFEIQPRAGYSDAYALKFIQFDSVIYAPLDPPGDYASPAIAGTPKPPQVDLANMRADFSSLFFSVYSNQYEEELTPRIGWNVGAAGWVPLTANADGSFTAQWLTPFATNYQDWGGRPFSITISAVPEPSTLLLALAGLGACAVASRARRPAEVQG